MYKFPTMSNQSSVELRALSKSQLQEMAKRAGFMRFSALNKDRLVSLLTTGSHSKPKAQPITKMLHSSRGVVPSEFDPSKFTITVETSPGGYVMRGLDIEGMFNSRFTPDRSTTRYEDVYGDPDTDDEDDPPQPIRAPVTRRVSGGWFIPASDYLAFKRFYESIPYRGNDPRTLFELSGMVVNSRKQTTYIPKRIQNSVRKLK
jgi:hypothetical protein